MDKLAIRAVIMARREILFNWEDEGRDALACDEDLLVDAIYSLLTKRQKA